MRLCFGFRYAAAGPIVQKEHSGWDTTCAVAKIIWPDLSNAKGPPPVLQRNVDEGRIGFKTKRGFFEWNDESIAKERARYERALRKCLEIFREEGICEVRVVLSVSAGGARDAGGGAEAPA